MERSDVLWLGGQVVLFLVAFAVVPLTGGRPVAVGLEVPVPLVLAVGLAAAGLALWSMRSLGRQLVPQPTPVAGGRVIDRGPYAVVRHPIYTAVLLLVLCVVLRWPGLGSGVVLGLAAVFLDAKAAHEEELLREAHAAYAGYVARVRWRLVPGVR